MCVYMFNVECCEGLVRWILVQLNLNPLQHSLVKYILYNLWHRTWTSVYPTPSHLLQSSVSSLNLIPVQDMTPSCALQLVWERKALHWRVLLLHLLYFVIIVINYHWANDKIMMIYYNIEWWFITILINFKKGALRTECIPPVAKKGDNSSIIYL